MSKPTLDYLMSEATTDDGLCNRDKVTFHYFNPNGLRVAWQKACERVTAAVNAGKVPSGWIIAYGSFNHFSADRLDELLHKGRVGRIRLSVTLDGLRRDIVTINEKLSEVGFIRCDAELDARADARAKGHKDPLPRRSDVDVRAKAKMAERGLADDDDWAISASEYENMKVNGYL